jgi:hypothetical protein
LYRLATHATASLSPSPSVNPLFGSRRSLQLAEGGDVYLCVGRPPWKPRLTAESVPDWTGPVALTRQPSASGGDDLPARCIPLIRCSERTRSAGCPGGLDGRNLRPGGRFRYLEKEGARWPHRSSNHLVILTATETHRQLPSFSGRSWCVLGRCRQESAALHGQNADSPRLPSVRRAPSTRPRRGGKLLRRSAAE